MNDAIKLAMAEVAEQMVARPGTSGWVRRAAAAAIVAAGLATLAPADANASEGGDSAPAVTSEQVDVPSWMRDIGKSVGGVFSRAGAAIADMSAGPAQDKLAAENVIIGQSRHSDRLSADEIAVIAQKLNAAVTTLTSLKNAASISVTAYQRAELAIKWAANGQERKTAQADLALFARDYDGAAARHRDAVTKFGTLTDRAVGEGFDVTSWRDHVQNAGLAELPSLKNKADAPVLGQKMK